jgi:hypothetical protein
MGKLGNFTLKGNRKEKLAPVSTGKKQDISPLHVQGLKVKSQNVLKKNQMTYPGQSPIKHAGKLNEPILKTKAPAQTPSSHIKNTSKLPSMLK